LVAGLHDALLDGADSLENPRGGARGRGRLFEAEARDRGAQQPVPREPETEESGEREDGRSNHEAHCRRSRRSGEKNGKPAYTGRGTAAFEARDGRRMRERRRRDRGEELEGYAGLLGRTRRAPVLLTEEDGRAEVRWLYRGVNAATDPALAELARRGELLR